MKCEQLQHLLETDATTPFDENTERIATYLRIRPQCQSGIVRLSEVLIANDTLSCEQCHRRLPTLYEATHPEYPLVTMPEEEIKRMRSFTWSLHAVPEGLLLSRGMRQAGE